MAQKLSVLKPRRLRNLYSFLLFSHHSFDETVSNFEKKNTCSGKNLSMKLNSYSQVKTKFKSVLTRFYYKKLRSSVSSESFLTFLLFFVVMRTIAHCISIVIR